MKKKFRKVQKIFDMLIVAYQITGTVMLGGYIALFLEVNNTAVTCLTSMWMLMLYMSFSILCVGYGICLTQCEKIVYELYETIYDLDEEVFFLEKELKKEKRQQVVSFKPRYKKSC